MSGTAVKKTGAGSAAHARCWAAFGLGVFALLILGTSARADAPKASTPRPPARAAPSIPPDPLGDPSRPSWHYGVPGRLHPAYEPPPVGAFLARKKRLVIGLEFGWPFYELRFAGGLHQRVELTVGYRGYWLWTYGAFAGLKIGLSQNKERSTAFSLKVLGGYRYLAPSTSVQMRQLGGGDGAFGEFWLLGSLREGKHVLLLAAGLAVSQVTACTDPEREADQCPPDPFNNNQTDLLVTASLELGWAMRLGRGASVFAALGVDLFVLGQVQSPAMARARFGFLWDVGL